MGEEDKSCALGLVEQSEAWDLYDFLKQFRQS